MKNPLVLIVDPFNSPLNNQIKNVISSQSNFDCVILNIKVPELKTIHTIPDLVIAWLSEFQWGVMCCLMENNREVMDYQTIKDAVKKHSSNDTLARKCFKGKDTSISKTIDTSISFPNNNMLIQRQPNCACGGGCPRCKEKALVQPKLKINAPDDIYEKEADEIADKIKIV